MVDPSSGPAWGAPPPPPPPPPPPGQGPWPAAALTPFRNLRGLAMANAILLGVAGFLALVHIPVVLWARSVVHDHASGTTFFASCHVLDVLNVATGVLSLFLSVSLAIAVVFIVWMWRAASNLRLLTAGRPRFGPGFAIGGWFIPIANLFIPGMQMADIWRGSPSADGTGRSVAPVWWWWVVFLIGRASVFASPADVRLGRLYRVSELDTRVVLSVVGDGFVAASAVLAIVVVRRITSRQEHAVPFVSTMAGPAPGPPTPAPDAPPYGGSPPPPPARWPGPGPSDP